MILQSVVRAIYPAQCIACDAMTDTDFALCPTCWKDVQFVSGLVCDLCGVPLPGDSDTAEHCDDCMQIARPWDKGRAAVVYSGVGRKLVLGLKHGDRTDLAPALAEWLMRAAKPLLGDDATAIVPIPLHWSRMIKRKYNQASLLALEMGRKTQVEVMPSLLVRTRRTASLEGHGREARFAALQGAISVRHGFEDRVRGRSFIVVDDVMTSGATFAAASEALCAAGAARVCVLALARVAKDTYI
jgi:ComF family protein